MHLVVLQTSQSRAEKIAHRWLIFTPVRPVALPSMVWSSGVLCCMLGACGYVGSSYTAQKLAHNMAVP